MRRRRREAQDAARRGIGNEENPGECLLIMSSHTGNMAASAVNRKSESTLWAVYTETYSAVSCCLHDDTERTLSQLPLLRLALVSET